MNRLIIVGNGFDLAHGMKTSYNDFIKWYLVTIFRKGNYDDNGVSVILNLSTSLNVPGFIEMYLKGQIPQDSINNLLSNSINPSGVGTDESLGYFFNFKYPFLKEVCIQHCDQNWVDIEDLYYKDLLRISRIDNESSRNQEVLLLNEALNFIKAKLKEYLITITVSEINGDIINALLDQNKYLSSISENANSKFDRMLFLNFNYTGTVDNYANQINNIVLNNQEKIIDQINIHGEIRKNENPIIFGFGDEMDDNYKRLEALKNNHFLDNMKSFGYFKTTNYHDLIRFIELEDYEVFMMGHSCGLSDRVMLNMIFENHNCKSIKLFYHKLENGDNFKKLTQDISRHFNKKNEMRKKIIPFDKSQSLPQKKL